jgi:hypothetical protein
MSNDSDFELSPEELEAFRALPREAAPNDLLEERVVRELRARSLLRSRGTALARAARAFRPLQWASGLAAALFLFCGGIAFDHWAAARPAPPAEERPAAPELAALRVQQAGSAYVTALASLNAQSGPGAGRGDALLQGREAALTALRAAARELARMHPDDPALADALAALNGAPAEAVAVEPSQTRQVLWF